MERGIIEADPRHTVRRIRTAMQGNTIRALVELITNSDDSYITLEEKQKSCKGTIEILYKKEGYCGAFAVRDYAEGMSLEEVRNGFKKYGAATSGMKMGKRVRGYFGQGAKDALAGMVDGKICSFKNDKFVECKLFIEHGKPMYEISDSTPATVELRSTHKIEKDGTIAYFKADRQKTGPVPRFNTVHEELANNYLLCKIMTNPRRKVILVDEDTGDTRPLRGMSQEGKEILVEDFAVSYGKYGDFPIHISIRRAERELSQIGDNRDGGLVLVDDEDTVLGKSLFKYDNEPLASHFFGEVRMGRFRELLINEEPVIREERDGLVERHPFSQMLIVEIEKRIEIKVNEERLRKQKEDKAKIDSDESTRYRKAFKILNEIAEIEAQTVTNLGQLPSEQIEEPLNGFCIYPSSAQITVGKRYAFEIRLNTKVVHHGSVIKVTCTNQKIRILTPEIKISTDDGTGILRKHITIEGSEPNIEGTLYATAGKNQAEAKIYVLPEKELLLSEGMVFQPQSVILRPNQPRRIYLLVYVKIIEGGSIIRISSDNESVHASKNEVIVNEADAIRHVAKYELDVWGEGVGHDAIITAEYEGYMALLEIRIRSKEEAEETGRKGMFSEPKFDPDPEPLQRTSYSTEIGKVIVYVNFPSVRHYLGDDCRYRKTLPAQVFVADLIAETCFHAIARKKVESSGVVLRPEAIPDRIQRDAYELSRKYGKKLHEALVDQKLIEVARSFAHNSVGK